MATKTEPFNPDEFFDSEESQLELLADAFESGHTGYIANAIGIVARKRGGMAKVAADAGIAREQIYQALSKDGNPTLATLLKITSAMGLELTVKAKASEAA